MDHRRWPKTKKDVSTRGTTHEKSQSEQIKNKIYHRTCVLKGTSAFEQIGCEKYLQTIKKPWMAVIKIEICY